MDIGLQSDRVQSFSAKGAKFFRLLISCPCADPSKGAKFCRQGYMPPPPGPVTHPRKSPPKRAILVGPEQWAA